ncbi:hypothetical protein PENARI_c010G10184 [Penicillium arizonense]|uniref:Uncharacterized protein n=1 Tax=Penicillium arizonense TaxID=1835702 RepID=A0A1F5LH66_PENAI|nr:hypothetical protein PENARI_c010G10184 [Penicillium arizonense]OGE52542.1 hypothetical protein PENARI_c010G10184 [Penicillium arizonense]
MSGFRNVMKDGWHPKGKEGGKESWRGDFKGINQVAGWMGKGRDPDSDTSEHVSQPLSSLKDPSSFGPPPKHINYHGAAAVPNQTTPDRRGIGVPLSQDQINAQNAHQQQLAQEEEEEAQKPAPPPVPYRVNTTGLSTDNLPPPPVRRMDSPAGSTTSSASKPKAPPKPPPRLPARNGSPASQSSDPPPAYSPTQQPLSHDYINQDATSRLANAGVSVPGFGIGGQGAQQSQTPVNELQSRFSQMRTNSGSPGPAPPPRASTNPESPASGSSSVQNFRDRHADKIDAGKQKYSNFREQHADSIDSGKQKVGDFRERHADTIDSGKQKYGDFRERHADKFDAGKQKYGDFRERHADSINAGKQKMSGAASSLSSRFGGSSAPPPSARASTDQSMNLEPAEPARGTSSVQSFRERHADKIDMGKEKWGGVTSRFNTFVEDRKFDANANRRVPRPPSHSMAQSPSPAPSPTDPDIQSQAQRKKAPPPPPPKRAEIRAPAVDSPSSPAPPPIPHGTKPR